MRIRTRSSFPRRRESKNTSVANLEMPASLDSRLRGSDENVAFLMKSKQALLRAKAALTRGCCLAALMLTATPAFAQDADIVVTGAALPEPIGDAAYDITVIDRDRITATASGRIEDVLKDVAGLTQFRRTDARSANATSQGATLRGLGGNASSRALLVLDGVPQTDPFGGWVTWPAFAPERIGQIRVTRGGGSGTLGPGALAGTIEFDSLNAVQARGVAATLAYGSRESVEGNVTAGGKLGSGFGFVSASYARGDGFVPIIAGQRGPADRASPYEQASLAARGVAPLSDNTELQASVLGFTDRRQRGTILSGNGGDGGDASLRLVHDGDWQWQALAYLQLRKFQSRFVSIDGTRTTVLQTVDQYNVPSTGIGARFEVRPPVGETLELRLGSDWRRVRGETNELFTYVAGRPTRGREAGGTSDTLGAFAEASATLGRLTLTGGGRVDRWSIRKGRLIERTLATGALLRNEIAPDRSGWEGTGRAGLALAAGLVTLRAAAYLGWRLPTLNELYRPFRVGADATAANAALSPERVRGVEIGVDWDIGDAFQLRATAFTNRLSKAIANVSLGIGPGVFPGVGFVAAGGTYRQRQNLDAIHSNGVELDASWTKGAWRAQASYALTSAKVRASGIALPLNGLRPAQVPKHTASALCVRPV
jgi:vitamin B12 transporter